VREQTYWSVEIWVLTEPGGHLGLLVKQKFQVGRVEPAAGGLDIKDLDGTRWWVVALDECCANASGH